MYTVEFDTNVVVTTLDEKGDHHDVELIIDDDGYFILRQFRSEIDGYDLIVMSRNQFFDLIASMNTPISNTQLYRSEDIA